MDSILNQSERIVRAMNRRAASGTMSQSTYRRRFNAVQSAATRYGENAFAAAKGQVLLDLLSPAYHERIIWALATVKNHKT